MLTLRLRTRLVHLALAATFALSAVAAPVLGPSAPVAAEQSVATATEQVYVRSGPSTADGIIGNLEAGDQVTTTGATANGFYEVWYGDWVGYVYGDYISVGGAPVAESSSPDVAWNGAVGTSYTIDSVNLRSGPSTSDSVITVVPTGAAVSLTGAVSGEFAQVESDYGSGWISNAYLGSAPAEAAPAPTATGNGGIVDFAMQYLGYPYVWAGNTPSGFDCSGFTQYVVQNVLGYDITHSTDIQATYGSPVGWGEWAPGDLVFFVGTGGSGYISHVGIYIGDGQMIHAENEGTGVVISSLYSSYYSGHYYSAVRL